MPTPSTPSQTNIWNPMATMCAHKTREAQNKYIPKRKIASSQPSPRPHQ